MEPLLPIKIVLPARGERTTLQQLHQQLRSAIVEGRLTPGLRLPSTRALAQGYGVGRNTAVAAYELLASEGYIVARRGSGTRIASQSPVAPAPPATGKKRRVQRGRVARYWHPSRLISKQPPPEGMRFHFRLGVPDAESFPVEIWRRLCVRESQVLRTAGGLETELQGLRALREAIARHVSFTRAVACTPEHVIVTAGAQQAFDLLARVFVTPTRTCVALEDPGYAPLRAAFAAAGGQLVTVPVDSDGLIVDALPRAARVICVTPSHQFPLGCVLSATRRAALLQFARARNAIIVEDDYDAEFRYTDRPLDALQTLDRQESVFYVGTFSKILLPTLRLGYLVVPTWARPSLLAAKAASDGPCGGLVQGVVAALIAGGHLARHLKKMRPLYQGRRERLLEGFDRELSAWLTPIPSAAGLHVAAALKRPLSDTRLAAAAQGLGVGVRALSAFSARRAPPGGLVFGFGAIPTRDIAPALSLLNRALTTCVREGRR